MSHLHIICARCGVQSRIVHREQFLSLDTKNKTRSFIHLINCVSKSTNYSAKWSTIQANPTETKKVYQFDFDQDYEII